MTDGQAAAPDLRAAVRAATARLAQAGIASAESDAVVLAAHALGVSVGDARKAMVLGAPVPAAYEEPWSSGPPASRCSTSPAGRASAQLEPRWGRASRAAAGDRGRRGPAIDAARAAGEAPVVVDLCTGSGPSPSASRTRCLRRRCMPWSWGRRTPGQRATGPRPGSTSRWSMVTRPRRSRSSTARRRRGRLQPAVHPRRHGSHRPRGAGARPRPRALRRQRGRPRDPARRGGAGGGSAAAGGVLVMEHADTQAGSARRARAHRARRDIADHEDLRPAPRATVAVRARRARHVPCAPDRRIARRRRRRRIGRFGRSSGQCGEVAPGRRPCGAAQRAARPLSTSS